jgi:hypothetical protein
MQIGWKVSQLTVSMASIRYRALLPMLALESVGVRNRLFSSGLQSNLEGLDALVIVKSFTEDDLFLAHQAASKGIRVVFDLCDNIFIDAYRRRGGSASPLQIFDAITTVADAIVVTTEPLAAMVRQHTPHVQVTVIPDGIETPESLESMGRLLLVAESLNKRQRMLVLWHKLHNVIFRLRQEGLTLAVNLAWRVLYRGHRALRKQWQRALVRGRSGGPATAEFAAPDTAASFFPGSTSATVGNVPRCAKTVLWFGNHGAPHARFGMLDLLEIRHALEAVAQLFDVELVVISNHRGKYEENIRPLRIPSRYIEWSTRVVNQWLAKADVVVVPNTLDPFSLCKSANRSVLAVSRGVPVVATRTPALDALGPHVHTGDALAGLKRYLSDREKGRRDAFLAYAQAEAAFGQGAIAQAWQQLLSQPRTARRVDVPAQSIVALNLTQDLDLALPVLDAWAREGVAVQVWCSGTLIRKSPRVLAAMETRRLAYCVLPDDLPTGSVVFPFDTKILLTISETNLGPHRFTRNLSELALAKGLTVATMQHGFENVGLTYDDAVHPIGRVSIKAQRIYIWGSLETLHPRLDASVRERCIPVGCPKSSAGESVEIDHLLPKDRPVVGVFENLHWHRYDDLYRQAFLDAAQLLAEQFPLVTFLVKPHHAGMWLTKHYEDERPAAPNLVIADPQMPEWEPYTASSLLGRLAAVITTPSTVALDAARHGLPVAVFAGGLDLSNYQPLPQLRDPNDWVSFVAKALHLKLRASLTNAAASFVERVLVQGDGAQRIVVDLADVVPLQGIPFSTLSKDNS